MWIVGVLIMILFWGGVAAVVVLLVRSLAGPGRTQRDSAMDTLRTRLAAGEISEEEFERIRKVIQS
jgi:putative membrane protein